MPTIDLIKKYTNIEKVETSGNAVFFFLYAGKDLDGTWYEDEAILDILCHRLDPKHWGVFYLVVNSDGDTMPGGIVYTP